MAIKVECPSCRKTISAPDDYKGKTIRCPNCGSKVPLQPPDKVQSKLSAFQVFAPLAIIAAAVVLLLQVFGMVTLTDKQILEMEKARGRILRDKGELDYRGFSDTEISKRVEHWRHSLIEEAKKQQRRPILYKLLLAGFLIATACVILLSRVKAVRAMVFGQLFFLTLANIGLLVTIIPCMRLYGELGDNAPRLMYVADAGAMLLLPIAWAASLVIVIKAQKKPSYSELARQAHTRTSAAKRIHKEDSP